MGDYYSGDPGFFSTLGSIAKGVFGAVTGLGSLGGQKAAPKALPAAAGVASTAIAKIAPVVSGLKTTALKHPVLTGAGAAGVVGLAGAGVGSALTKRAMTKGLRKHRRMRVTNPKALRRALRRAYGFERLAMRTIRLLHPRKHARFGGFKKARRRAA